MGQMISFPRPDGETIHGYLANAGENRPGIVVIQEWWGLNDQICGVADRFARHCALARANSIRKRRAAPAVSSGERGEGKSAERG